MASRGRADGQLLAYLGVALGVAALSLALLQLLLGRRLERAQIQQLGSELASSLALGEVALERFSPATLEEISGMELLVGRDPDPGATPRGLAVRLERELCRRVSPCPAIRPAGPGRRGAWVEMASPLEAIWLFAPLPSIRGWPPDPLLLSLSLGMGGVSAVLLFLTLEVQRPLRQLEGALGDVDLEVRPPALTARGSRPLRQLTAHFNAMLERLERSSQERRTMLAGIAHDLRAPLTRLRLRLELAAEGPMEGQELARAEADLSALERITRQFLLFAGLTDAEPVVAVPLDELLSEVAAVADASTLQLELTPLSRRVRPTALVRAVSNLVDNALAHGSPPVRLVLRSLPDEGFEIQVWDRGTGIPEQQWEQAVKPFQRLDPARGGGGHCGLGLAIADRVARDHGGELRRLQGDGSGGFGIALRGRSLPPSHDG